MKKDVLVSVIGKQMEYNKVEDSSDEPIEIICPATYFFKDGAHYVFYEEVQEGSTSVTQNKIIFREKESLEVVKKGATNSHMCFSMNEPHVSNYETSYGQLLLGVTTIDMVSNIEETQMTIQAVYEMDINCEPYAQCEIIMKIRDKELGM